MDRNSLNSLQTQGVGNTILPLKKARSWCFTINNHTVETWNSLTHLNLNFQIKKIIFQEEKGENDTPHIQGVIQFKNQILFNTLKELYPTAHWEICRTLKGSIKYCSKEETRAGKQFSYGIKDTEMWKPQLTEEEWLNYCKEQHYEECKKNMDEDFCSSFMKGLL